MMRVAFLLVGVAMAVATVGSVTLASGKADGNATPVFVTQMAPGYRNWTVISVAHEEGERKQSGRQAGQ
jgi:hypothetical protein